MPAAGAGAATDGGGCSHEEAAKVSPQLDVAASSSPQPPPTHPPTHPPPTHRHVTSSSSFSTSSSTTQRLLIALVGEMNAGKSTCLNALTQQATAIVDSTPGTTADVKAAVMELHGLGPVKLLDTAGVDDTGELGAKKKAKSWQALREADLALVVIDPCTKLLLLPPDNQKERRKCAADPTALAHLQAIVHEMAKRGRQALLVFNLKQDRVQALGGGEKEGCLAELLASIEAHLTPPTDPPTLLPSFAGDFSDAATGKALALHLVAHLHPPEAEVPLVPPTYHDKVVFLNIPMDAETPHARLLRPQALIQEFCLRNFIPTVAYRMDLGKARASDAGVREEERKRFLALVGQLPLGSLLITDSQAVDVVHPWTEGIQEKVDVTTFSIALIQYMSGGRLQTYVDGLAALLSLHPGDKVLIAEACNHIRIPEACDDIGTVQIPRKLQAFAPPGGDLVVHHSCTYCTHPPTYSVHLSISHPPTHPFTFLSKYI